MSEEMLELLVRELELDADDVSVHTALIDLTCLWQLHALDRPELKDQPWPPVTAGRVVQAPRRPSAASSRCVRERALMVHHPYESFASSVEAFIDRGGRRPAGAVDQDDAVPRPAATARSPAA